MNSRGIGEFERFSTSFFPRWYVELVGESMVDCGCCFAVSDLERVSCLAACGIRLCQVVPGLVFLPGLSRPGVFARTFSRGDIHSVFLDDAGCAAVCLDSRGIKVPT